MASAARPGLEQRKVHGLQHGGSFLFDEAVRVKLTLAFHGSVLPDGSNGGNPCGFIVTFPDGTKIYDAADTALFGDMALIGEEGLDLAILPIGDYYTMGPDDALRAVKLLRAPLRPADPLQHLSPDRARRRCLGRPGQERDVRPARSSSSRAIGSRFPRSEGNDSHVRRSRPHRRFPPSCRRCRSAGSRSTSITR